jgi:hypothetical protein
MPTGRTYTPIATTTAASASPAITFSNISQNYTDLVLVVSVRANSTPTSFGTGIRFNSDTGSNYSRTVLYGSGSSAVTFRDTSQTRFFVSSGPTAVNTFNIIRFNIMNYSNSTTYKTVLARNDDISDVTSMSASVWRSTSAITSITVTPFDDNSTGFALGSTFTLYGILAA